MSEPRAMMTGTSQQPVKLQYAVASNPWPSRAATAGVCAAGAFAVAVLLICVINMTTPLPLLLFMLTPFVALSLGITARVTSAPDDEQTRGKARLAITTGCVGIALIAMVLPAMSQMGRPRETSKRVRCASNLRHIGQALDMYANANRGVLPATLDVLLTNIDIESSCFVCPSTGLAAATGATPQQTAAAMAASPGKHLSYAYLAPAAKFASLPWNYVVVCEPAGNHKNDGMNVLFADRHVEWLGARTAKHVLAELASGHNPPRGFTPGVTGFGGGGGSAARTAPTSSAPSK